MIKQSNSLETLAEKEMLPPLQQSNHSAQRIPIFPTSTCSSFSKINSRHDTPVRKFLFWFAYYTWEFADPTIIKPPKSATSKMYTWEYVVRKKINTWSRP